MFKKILLALGDSPESQEILTAGLTLSEKFDAEILLLHVINPLKSTSIICEVVGFSNELVLLMPFEDTEGVGSGAEVDALGGEEARFKFAVWAR